jgi:hypothetical protein
MSNRCIPITLCAATAIPFGLLGGFGPTGDHSIVPWLGFLAGWGACSYGRWQAVRLLRSAGRPVLRHRRPQSRSARTFGRRGG